MKVRKLDPEIQPCPKSGSVLEAGGIRMWCTRGDCSYHKVLGPHWFSFPVTAAKTFIVQTMQVSDCAEVKPDHIIG